MDKAIEVPGAESGSKLSLYKVNFGSCGIIYFATTVAAKSMADAILLAMWHAQVTGKATYDQVIKSLCHKEYAIEKIRNIC
jgi:hypothetical protein